MSKKSFLIYMFFIFTVYLLTFQYFLENQIPILKNIDEFYAFLFIPVLFSKINKKKFLSKDNIKVVILILLIIILGIISNFIFKYQKITYVLMDIVLFLKFFFAVGLSTYLFNGELIEKYNNKIKFHVQFIIIILFFSTILNYLFYLWPNSNIRFGIMPNQIFFGHPTKLSAVLFFLLTLYNIVKKGKFDLFYILISIMIFTTLRMKAILALIVSLFVIYYVGKKQNKINFKKLTIVGILICLLGFNSFEYYFMSDGFARAELLKSSFKIAKDYFPLGTGFGTFGSWASGVSYSPVYYQYGLNKVWGISPYNYLAIADSFWPTVLGQFGYLGLTLYLIVILKMFGNIQKEYCNNYKYIYSSKLIAFVYLIISSTSESAFFNQLAVPLGIIIGLNFNKIYKESEKNGANI